MEAVRVVPVWSLVLALALAAITAIGAGVSNYLVMKRFLTKRNSRGM